MQESNISFCTAGDVDDLIRFIGKYWKENHIFTRDRALFDFQHRIDDQNYSFVIARQGAEIVACLGFTAIDQYRKPEERQPVLGKHPFFGKGLWLCLWKSREDVAAGMGFYLLRFLEDTLEPEWMSATGYSQFSERVFKMLHWERSLMKHYFRVNPALKPAELTLVKANQSSTIQRVQGTETGSLVKTAWGDILTLNTAALPYKDPAYLLGRYQRHPSFDYDLWTIKDSNKTASYLIVRLVEVPEGKCLRIIDLYGDINTPLNIENPDIFFSHYPGIQYVDFLCEGINEGLLYGLGLREKTEGEMVPEYFSPFSPQNVTIKAAVNRPLPGFYYTKGDADQDRPN
jgi:hypothetical protein